MWNWNQIFQLMWQIILFKYGCNTMSCPICSSRTLTLLHYKIKSMFLPSILASSYTVLVLAYSRSENIWLLRQIIEGNMVSATTSNFVFWNACLCKPGTLLRVSPAEMEKSTWKGTEAPSEHSDDSHTSKPSLKRIFQSQANHLSWCQVE